MNLFESEIGSCITLYFFENDVILYLGLRIYECGACYVSVLRSFMHEVLRWKCISGRPVYQNCRPFMGIRLWLSTDRAIAVDRYNKVVNRS